MSAATFSFELTLRADWQLAEPDEHSRHAWAQLNVGDYVARIARRQNDIGSWYYQCRVWVRDHDVASSSFDTLIADSATLISVLTLPDAIGLCEAAITQHTWK